MLGDEQGPALGWVVTIAKWFQYYYLDDSYDQANGFLLPLA